MSEILLSPFIFVISKLYALSLLISGGNPGLAIIFLSIFIFFLTTPINSLVSKLIKRENEKKNKIKHLIDEINEVYKGQTRFYYLKNLYKINGIRQFSDLAPTIKLFVQIPFFIAAYYYLQELEVFNKKSFLFISDLSKPDQAFPFAGIKLNILPITMFVINILNSYVFAKDNKRELRTLQFTGLLFLFLLYPMKSCLVLYWTLNNLISFIIELLKSKEWITLKVHGLKQINKRINIFELKMLLFCLSTLALFSNIFLTGEVNYIYFTIYALILVLISISPGTKFHKDISFKLAFFQFLGALTPLFIYAKKNSVFLRDGFYLDYYTNLIVPSFLVFVISYLFFRKQKKSYYIIFINVMLFVFLFRPSLTMSLKLTAENSLIYHLLFFIFLALMIRGLARNNHKRLSYFFAVIALFASIDSMRLYFKYKGELKKVSNILKNDSRRNMLKNKIIDGLSTDKIKTIYLLIYDALGGPKLNEFYGIDNTEKFSFLKKEGFTLYNDILTSQPSSIVSMAATLDMSHLSAIYKHRIKNQIRKTINGHSIIDDVYETFGKNRYYVASPYFFKGQTPKKGSQVYKVGAQNNHENLLLKAVLLGEFKFDIGKRKDDNLTWLDIEKRVFHRPTNGFLYMHYPNPSHSQNSGKCLKNEVELYKKRLLNDANLAMKRHIKLIKKNDPNAIIIVAGDHGAYLTADCLGDGTNKMVNANLSTLADVYGTTVAIKWPDKNFKKYDKFKSLQGVLLSVMSYLKDDKSLLQHLPTGNICRGKVCVKEDATILTGEYKGQNLFDVLKYFKLEQY